VREYTYAYAAVSPADGELDTLILPDMYADVFSVFLAELSIRHPDDLIVMVFDGAPCHRAGTLIVPRNIRLVPLPPYSAELNPVEHLWDEAREKHCWNETFPSMTAVRSRLVTALRELEENRSRIISMTLFPWIKRALY
jgi:transposase